MYKGEGAEVVNRAIKEVIGLLADNGISSVIAGGFMRDNALGRPWRDIDLYVDQVYFGRAYTLLLPETEAVPVTEDNILAALATETPFKVFSSDSPEYKHQSIQTQVEFTSTVMDGALVNLIGLHTGTPTPSTVIGCFNLGICMAATDGYSGLLHERFLRDAADQKITMYREEWGYEGTMKNWVKLQKKYPGWNLRLPEAHW